MAEQGRIPPPPPPELSERARPCWHPDFRFLAPELGDNQYLLFEATQFGAHCSGSPRKPLHQLSEGSNRSAHAAGEKAMSQSQTIPGRGPFLRWLPNRLHRRRSRKTLCSGHEALWQFSAPSSFLCRRTVVVDIQRARWCNSRNSRVTNLLPEAEGRRVRRCRQVQARKPHRMPAHVRGGS